MAERARGLSSLLHEAVAGDRLALARLISALEQGGDTAREVSRLAFPRGGRAYTVGVTGPPGVGKSTLTDGLVRLLRADGSARVGVLAVDPSSPRSGGAILGDRVRMQDHATDEGVFIRSMASRGRSGGLSVAVPSVLHLLDAVGMDPVLVETVGVGQVEVDVAAATDTTLVILAPGWGDSVQANKAGLLEVADVLAVNKADRPGTREAVRDLETMLDLSSIPDGAWRPPVLTTSATKGDGVADLLDAVNRHRAHLETDGGLEARRRTRLGQELRDLVTQGLHDRAEQVWASADLARLTDEVTSRRLDPVSAAHTVLERSLPVD